MFGHSILKCHDFFLQFRQVLVVNRAHLKEQLVKMIEIVFSDLTFEVTVPQLPPGYKTMTSKERRKADEDRRNQIALQHRQKIKHLAVHHSFIYEYDVRNRMLIKKFHGPYIVNAIAVLFTGPDARIPTATEEKQLS